MPFVPNYPGQSILLHLFANCVNLFSNCFTLFANCFHVVSECFQIVSNCLQIAPTRFLMVDDVKLSCVELETEFQMGV